VTLFSLGFRPFFGLAALQACVSVPWWLAVWVGLAPTPAWLSPSLWHAHEMIFGFVAAAAAGFLLTAAPTWTQTRPVAGAPLAVLAALWLAGRAGMALAGVLPAWAVAALDLAFLPALAFAVGRGIVAARQRRNYGFPALLSALALLNLAVHLDALGVRTGVASVALHGAVDLAIVLIVWVGGRITPAFTANALRRAGSAVELRTWAWLERATLVAVVAYAGADLVLPRTIASGSVALAAALLVGARLSGWQGARTLRDPLLASLHLGYLWVAVGLFAVALADLTGRISWSVAVHALTVGAIGTMVLAVMTRVALGHTGRPLVAPRAAVAAYLLVSAAALARTAGAVVFAADYPNVLALAGLLWASAYAVFLAHYGPILVRPRVDAAP
jgi:uncharacterized protein involved in response to NO